MPHAVPTAGSHDHCLNFLMTCLLDQRKYKLSHTPHNHHQALPTQDPSHTLTHIYTPMMVVAAPAAEPATSHLVMVCSSKFLSMNRPTIIQLCILKAFSGMIPKVREITPAEHYHDNQFKTRLAGMCRLPLYQQKFNIHPLTSTPTTQSPILTNSYQYAQIRTNLHTYSAIFND